MNFTKGRIHSFQSLGTLDGPGIRFVVFLQGCPLRCACCHNPDTWDVCGGKDYTAEEVVARAVRFREYFGEQGGVTLSGGEPLLQAGFAAELFRLCHEAGIGTCLDTSGCLFDDGVRAALVHCDRVLLDVKYTHPSDYLRYTGCDMSTVLDFLAHLDSHRIPTTLRQVIIPTLNDTEDGVRALGALAEAHACVDGIELLPFRKICQTKYDAMGIPFPLSDVPEPSAEHMTYLRTLLPPRF